MISAYITGLLVGGIVYLYFVGRIIRGLVKLRSEHAAENRALLKVSVVIAARNEENVICKTLTQVLDQDYPNDLYEVIVIDDRSEDSTARIVETFAETNSRVRLIRQTTILADLSPKKQALECGIQATTGDIIITTDADCAPGRGWIRALVSRFGSDTGMVLGQAIFNIGTSPPLWQRLQALDFRSQGFAAAGLAADGIPFSCTGASLAFRKQTFDDIQGYDGVNKLISGDDELLLAKVSCSRWKIIAAGGSEVVVPTRSPASLRELWHQRIRWGSKGLYIETSRKLILSGIFLFFLALSIGPLVCTIYASWWVWSGMMAMKWILDFVSVSIGKSVFNENVNMLDFIILELIHAPAMVIFATAGHILSFEWRGQRFHSRGSTTG